MNEGVPGDLPEEVILPVEELEDAEVAEVEDDEDFPEAPAEEEPKVI